MHSFLSGPHHSYSFVTHYGYIARYRRFFGLHPCSCGSVSALSRSRPRSDPPIVDQRDDALAVVGEDADVAEAESG